MGIAIVSGSGGLIGSESVRLFASQGFEVIGLEFGIEDVLRDTYEYNVEQRSATAL
jgi:hypothetical protein